MADGGSAGGFLGVTQDALPFVGNVVRALFYFSRGWVDDLVHDPRAVRWSYIFLVAQLLYMHYNISVRWQWLLVYGARLAVPTLVDAPGRSRSLAAQATSSSAARPG
jgi:hypothetical protein